MPLKRPAKSIRTRVWKSPEQAARVAFAKRADGKHTRLGGTTHGDVFVGRLHFKDGSTSRVAIKVFREHHKLTDAKARQYQQVIDELRGARFRIPKMGMVKMPSGEWVQVSQLFGSTAKGSKIVDKSWFKIPTKRGRHETIRKLTKLANLGYKPVWDLIEPFRETTRGIIPIDIDLLVEYGKIPVKERAIELKRMASRLTEGNTPKEIVEGLKEYRELMAMVKKMATPELCKAITEHKGILT